MKSIRNHTFETNSSSCHSISFLGTGRLYDKPGLVRLETNEIYSGSGNLVYDEDTPWGYDAGEDLGLEDKINYVMINLVEYFNRRASVEDKFEWYKNHPDKIPNPRDPKRPLDLSSKYMENSNIHYQNLPAEVYERIVEEYNSAVKGIIQVFEDNGIEVENHMPEPEPLDKINSGSYAWVDDVFQISGAIDHDSSCSQHEDDPWELAEMSVSSPEDLYQFIMDRDCTINVRFDG